MSFDTPLHFIVQELYSAGLSMYDICDKLEMEPMLLWRAIRLQIRRSARTVLYNAVLQARRQLRDEAAAERAEARRKRAEELELAEAARHAKRETDRLAGVTNPNPMNGILRFFNEHPNKAVGYSTFYRRCRQGMDWEQAITEKGVRAVRGPLKRIYLEAQSPAVGYRTFVYRVMTVGMSVDDALTRPHAHASVPIDTKDAVAKAAHKASLNSKPFAVVDRLRGPMVYSLSQAETYGMTILKVVHPDGSIEERRK